MLRVITLNVILLKDSILNVAAPTNRPLRRGRSRRRLNGPSYRRGSTEDAELVVVAVPAKDRSVSGRDEGRRIQFPAAPGTIQTEFVVNGGTEIEGFIFCNFLLEFVSSIGLLA
jgi:hypothetical protein